MSEAAGGGFIDQFEKWAIPLFFAVSRKAKNAGKSPHSDQNKDGGHFVASVPVLIPGSERAGSGLR